MPTLSVPLHFTLELEGLRDQGSFNGYMNLHGVLYGMQPMMVHSLLDFASSPSQRVGSNTKQTDHHNPSRFVIAYYVAGAHMNRMVMK